jgi:hypothetical protein
VKYRRDDAERFLAELAAQTKPAEQPTAVA